VLDSISSTPRGRAPTRLQQQHTLQAVASRLQHVYSSELPQSQRSLSRNPHGAGPSVYDDCSDTASWADEHVSGILLFVNAAVMDDGSQVCTAV